MSQREPSPGCSSDNVQRNPRKQMDSMDPNDEDTPRRSRRNHPVVQDPRRSPTESPLDPMFESMRHRSRGNQIYPVESTYSPGRMIRTDLPEAIPPGGHIDSMDSPKSRVQYPQSHPNNAHCQRLPADTGYLQHLMNEPEVNSETGRTSRRPCTMEDRYRQKHSIDERSVSPTSSSDATEVFTSPRHSRHRQHSSHRHRLANQCKDTIYQATISPQVHPSPSGRHRQNHCHRYHEIGQPTSCSPVCDSGIKEDDGSSSALSHHRDRFSSCEDITLCPTNGNQTNHGIITDHHRMSSGVSCESSTSSPSIRTRGTIEHCVTDRHRNHPRHTHVIQPYALDHPQRVETSHPETKSPLLISLEGFQIAAPPGKKCQCHIDHIQQTQHNQEQMPQQNQMHHHRNLYHEHEQFSQDKRGGPEGEDNADNMAVVVSRIHQPPALPPRPPPRTNRIYDTSAYDNRTDNGDGGCCKKYVVLCCLCGALSAAVGSLFLAVHAVLSAHTASLMHFETVPSYIPGTMLILMGFFTMLLARRKHRYGLLMKVCGSVGVVCALVCVLVTVTTTVVHMSKLQSLRECVYTARARSCTCYGTSQSRSEDTGVLFEGTPHCEAVHGALYACLRALFGVSVAGILACIFSCMLVYQLLSHEKKKMYWEQLELRCRSLYGQGGGAPVGGTTAGSCGCCNDCGGVSPWWAQTPGNLYTPNPDLAPSRWRLPWSRSRGPAPSPDSNYGFHAQSLRHANELNEQSRDVTTAISAPYGFIDSRQSAGPYSVLNPQNNSYTPSTASYSVLEAPVPLWGPPPPYSDPNSPARRPQIVEPKGSSSGGSSSGIPTTPAGGAIATPSRLASVKRTGDNFESSEDHNVQRTPQHCAPTDNYENTEELSPPELECTGVHESTTMKARRSRRALKGVENDAFQQEQNHQLSSTKQSESELYFGDVSSCCGPESSLYEMAVEKELNSRMDQDDLQQKEYMASRMSKHRLSKRNRLPLPLPPGQASPHQELLDGNNDRNYTNGEESLASSGAFLAPDAQYEVIQQGARYGFYARKPEEEFREPPAGYGFYRDAPETDNSIREYRSRDDDSQQSQEDLGIDKLGRREHQCCSNSVNDLETEWQSVEQKLKSDDGVCPINV
ncbi:uncharacterized protein [Fopius arisanus]|uniref:Uncharacterized protein isoform X2 n=1 Tax=Fopius arisanus TaxID=64838 RepID=A0A9R1U5R5_9HYME|nr:PREDICTED: uncharacterized protein LOC105269488 isoform X2 [Fopius arisanus]